MIPVCTRLSLTFCLVGALAGCAGTGGLGPDGQPRSAADRAHHALALAGAAGDGPGDHARALAALPEPVRDLPRSRRGNTDGYTVFGREYRVLDTAHGHREDGVASWYGAKFHGRDTSSGEPYDMHRLTAAHKSLPLPTFVRVTRSDTGASVVVKVNDRGPFVDDRAIDLSFAAAAQLDMLGTGTAPVRIEALSSPLDGTAPARIAAAGDAVAAVPDAVAARWIQLGAFGSVDNARALYDDAAGSLGLPTRLEHDVAGGLYRVRLGPFDGVGDVERATSQLANAGFASYTLVHGAQAVPNR